MRDPSDYYATLGVAPDAPRDEIYTRFVVLAERLHPRNDRGPERDAQFRAVVDAWEVLKDEARRSAYDADRAARGAAGAAHADRLHAPFDACGPP